MKHIATNADADLLGLDAERVWDTEQAYAHLKARETADSKRTAERRLNAMGLLPAELREDALQDELDRAPNQLVLDWAIEQARKKRMRVLFAQLSPLPNAKACLHANDARGARFWIPLQDALVGNVQQALSALQQHIGKPIAVFPHGVLVGLMREINNMVDIQLYPQAYRYALPAERRHPMTIPFSAPSSGTLSPHLKRLEAASIHSLREAFAEAQKPVMHFSADKNSSVMLHLARKAFYPSAPPLPLLQVEADWQNLEMMAWRDFVASEIPPDKLVSAKLTGSDDLIQVLDLHQVDVVISGNHSEKENIGGSGAQPWHPAKEPLAFWNLNNPRKSAGEHRWTFPLADWTELDIWQYIHAQNIPIAPLYFARPRAVVMRSEKIVLVDDANFSLQPGEEIEIRTVRLRSLDDYPLTGAVASEAETLQNILLEAANNAEAMRAVTPKQKKQEGNA